MGDAAEEILKLAANKKADLIITGARGLGAIERFLSAAFQPTSSITAPPQCLSCDSAMLAGDTGSGGPMRRGISDEALTLS